MIITIIFIVILTIGIMLWLFSNWNSNGQMTGILMTIFSGLILMICLGSILGAYTDDKVQYDNLIAEKEILEYRLANSNDINGNELLYRDVVKFNDTIRTARYWANNPWTSWFNGQKVPTIDYIEIPELKIGENENEN